MEKFWLEKDREVMLSIIPFRVDTWSWAKTFEEAAIKEIKEETSLELINPKVICVTNNIETYKKEGKHYISISLLATEYRGEPKTMEPEKCKSWQWVNPNNLPTPHFDASRLAIKCYLEKKFYTQ